MKKKEIIKVLRKGRDRAVEQLYQVRSELEKTLRHTDHLRTENMNQQALLSNANKNLDEFAAMLDKANEKIEQLESPEMKSMEEEAEIDQLNHHWVEVDKLSKRYEKRIMELEDQNRQLSKKIESQEQAIKLYKADKISTDKELYTEEQALNHEIENNRKTIDNLIKNKASFEKRIRELEKEVDSWKGQYAKTAKEKERLEKRINELKEQLEAKNIEFNKAVEEQVQSFQDRFLKTINVQNETILKLQQQLTEARKQLSEAHDLINTHTLIPDGCQQISVERVKKYEPRGRGDNSPCRNCGQMKWNHAVGWVCKKETALDKIRRQHEGEEKDMMEGAVTIEITKDGEGFFKGQRFAVRKYNDYVYLLVNDENVKIPSGICEEVGKYERAKPGEGVLQGNDFLMMEGGKAKRYHVRGTVFEEVRKETLEHEPGKIPVCKNCGKTKDEHLFTLLCV